MMFDFMIEENDEVKNLLEKFLDEEDIAFIKELIHGDRKVFEVNTSNTISY